MADIGAKIKLDGGAEFERNLKNIATASKQLNSELKLVASQFSKNATSTQALSAKSQVLVKQIDTQKQRIKQLSTQCQQAQTKLDALGKEAEEAAAEFGENSVEAQRAASAYDKQAGKVDRLKTQLNNAKVALNGMEDELKHVQQQNSAFGQLSIKAEEFGKKAETIGSKLKYVSTGFAALGAASIKSAVDFESAFAGVTKTVDGTDAQLAKIKQGIWDLAESTSSSATDIAAVAEAAGQLGIKTDDILSFTETMVMLGDTTNISADEAATSIAKLANITGLSSADYSRFGSAIVDLGNNLATTESDIVAFATRIAASGTQIGLSNQDILALSAALSSVGLEAEAGGTAISTIMSRIDKDVATGSATLQTWADTAGMSVEQFKQAWGTDAMSAIQAVISGMGDAKAGGENLNLLLDELGITNIRTSDTMKRLANASSILGDAVDTANGAWSENTAMQEEAEKRYQTTAAQINQLIETVKELISSLGETMLPTINAVATKLKELAKSLSNASPQTKKFVSVLIMMGAAASPVFTAVGKVASGVSKLANALSNNESGLRKFIALMKKAATSAAPMISRLASLTAQYARMTASALINTAVLVKNRVATIAAANAQKALAVAMVVGKFLLIGAAIAAAGVLLYKFATNTDAAVAAVENFSKKLTDMSNKFAAMAPQIADAIATALPALLEAVVNMITSLVTAMTNALPALTAAVPRIIETIVKGLVLAFPALIVAGAQLIQTLINAIAAAMPSLIGAANTIITTLSQAIITALPQLIDGALQIVLALCDAIISALPQLITAAVQIMTTLVQGLVSAIPQLIAAIPQIIQGIITGITENLPTVINGAIQIMKALIQGLISALPQLVAALPTIIAAIVSGLLSMLSRIFSVGVQILKKLWSGISSWIGSLYGKVTSFASSLPGKIKSGIGSLVSVGVNWVKGLWSGIGSVKDWIISKIKGMGSSILDSIKSIFKINSPSKETEEIGVYVGEGLGIGIAKSTRSVVSTAQKQAQQVLSAYSALDDPIEMGGLETAGATLRQTMQKTLGVIEGVGVTARNSFDIAIDYDRLERMQSKGIYLDGRLIGRELKARGVVFE